MSRSPLVAAIRGFDCSLEAVDDLRPVVPDHALTRRQRRLVGIELLDGSELSPQRRSQSLIVRTPKLAPVPEDNSIHIELSPNDNVFSPSTVDSLDWDPIEFHQPGRASSCECVEQTSTEYTRFRKQNPSTESNIARIGSDSLIRYSVDGLDELFNLHDSEEYPIMEAEVCKHKTQLNRLSMIVEDDIQPVVFTEVTSEFLKTKLS